MWTYELTRHVTCFASVSYSRNVLQPEISYTAYNTICYLVVGSSHRRLLNDQLRVPMKPSSKGDAAPLPKKTLTLQGDTKKKMKKRKLVEPDIIDISD